MLHHNKLPILSGAVVNSRTSIIVGMPLKTIRQPIRSAQQSTAVLIAFVVTFLWSTSWVLIKIGLVEIPPLTFAGMRYLLATLVLFPLALRQDRRQGLRSLSRRGWLDLVLLGIVFYTFTQGAMFFSLAYLPAATVSLVLSFTPLLVGVLGVFVLTEKPARGFWFGAGLCLLGSLIYLAPFTVPTNAWLGWVGAVFSLLANTAASLLGRSVNRKAILDPVLVTLISMGIGAIVLFGAGVIFEGPPVLSVKSIFILLWLAVVNSAAAFTLWNRVLRTLDAAQSSLINNTMLFQIVILAWLFLGESLTLQAVVGLLLAGGGVFLAQYTRRKF
jgi:drug/metabolite transporter (DMT)-like permease